MISLKAVGLCRVILIVPKYIFYLHIFYLYFLFIFEIFERMMLII